jgi:hypothetical protein
MANLIKVEPSRADEPIRISFSLPRIPRPRDPKLIVIALLSAALTYGLANGCVRNQQALDKQRQELEALKQELKDQSYPASFKPDPKRDTAKDAVTPAAAPAPAPAPAVAATPSPAPAPAPQPSPPPVATGPGGLDTPYPSGGTGPGDY